MAGRRGDAVAAAILLALSIAYTLEALRLPAPKYAVGPGPAFLPLLLGPTLAVLALALLVASILRRGGPEAPAGGGDWRSAWRIPVILVTLLAYALVFEHLGYVVSTALFLGILLAVVEPQSRWVVVGVPVTASILSWLLFVRWLRIPFPRGPFGY